MPTLSTSTSAILRFVGWSFLPSALADAAIKGYYRVIKPGKGPPRRGTPAYAQAHRIAFTTLAAAYLIYTLIAAATSLQPNYYHILGVTRDADEQALKTAFRKFARRNHPDRPDIGAAGAERFREVRDAYEMLKNPVKRFAYERFGPEIISWKDCTTTKEYLRHGLSASSGFPLGTAVVLGFMSILGQSSSSAFWRYVILGTFLFTELYLIMSPSIPLSSADVSSYAHSIPLLHWLLPFQQIIVLHQAFVSLSICLSHLGPVLFPNAGRDDKEVLRAVSDVIQRIAGVGGAAEHEVNRMIQSELRTLRGVRPSLPSPMPSYTQASADDDATVDTLASEMESLLIDARLRAHPVISTMWERVADDARDRLASATSPIGSGPGSSAPATMHAASSPHSKFRAEKGILTSPPSSPGVSTSTAPNTTRGLYSYASSPISPSQTPASSDTYLPSPEVDPTGGITTGGLSESEQSEETATLIDLDQGRSRSASPFTSINLNTANPPTSSYSWSRSHGKVDASNPNSKSPAASNVVGTPVPSTPRSLGRSSGGKLGQKPGLGGATTSPASGPRFFTSAFSSLKDS